MLDPSKFRQAIGTVFGFSIQGAGKANERGYEIYSISFKGTVPEMLPVAVPEGGSNAPLSGSGMAGDEVGDILF